MVVSPSIALGPTVSRLITRLKLIAAMPMVNGRAVSSPMMPFAASVKVQTLSVSACGAWSVPIASMVPSAKPSIKATRSSSDRSGGAILELVS